jgi:hypothetical protein
MLFDDKADMQMNPSIRGANGMFRLDLPTGGARVG